LRAIFVSNSQANSLRYSGNLIRRSNSLKRESSRNAVEALF